MKADFLFSGMAKYNFDQVYSRDNTSCVKYDLRKEIFGNESVIPMWVADMDIPTPDFIIRAINDRCNHPFLGYTFRDNSYHNSIVRWVKLRHGWDIKAEWINFCPGVVAGLNQVILAFTQPNDKIIIQPPVYHPFFHTVANNSRQLILNPLKEVSGHYQFDVEDLERKIKLGAKMLILSNPHNPVGRVWNETELKAIGDLCTRYNIITVSDEIHSDLVFRPNKHLPFASLKPEYSQNSITLGAPSKTFNTAGLATGFVIIPNKDLFEKYKKSLEMTGAGLGNLFGIEALKASFTPEGGEWLQELLDYLKGNIELVQNFLNEKLPQVKFTPPEGTYLLWLDFRDLDIPENKLNELLVNIAGIGFNSGSGFGDEGAGFQRMNIACPRSIVQEVLVRLEKAFSDFKT